MNKERVERIKEKLKHWQVYHKKFDKYSERDKFREDLAIALSEEFIAKEEVEEMKEEK